MGRYRQFRNPFADLAAELKRALAAEERAIQRRKDVSALLAWHNRQMICPPPGPDDSVLRFTP